MKQIFVQFITNDSFKIVYQTDVGNCFLDCTSEEESLDEDRFYHEGFWLSSREQPEVYSNGLYVIGRREQSNDVTLRFRSIEWKRKLLKAIEAYNIKYGGQ
jgi:hypothetical protein